MDLDHVRRQRKEILQLQRAGIGTASAELSLGRMLAKIEGLVTSGTAQEGGGRAHEREGGHLAVARRACRTAPTGNARGSLLSIRPGDHRCGRSVRRESAGQPRLLLNKPYGVG